jgi:hypothetical protein
MAILPFRPRTRQPTDSHSAPRYARCRCGRRFEQRAPHHMLCATCYGWGKAGWFVMAASRALQETESNPR